jgi:acetolactate synthase-1/2/3 large subunit
MSEKAHPRSGEVITGAEMIAEVIAQEGIDTIFGYSGGAILPTYDAIYRYNDRHGNTMPLIVPANEQGAGFMAAGYSRASGKVGVAIVTSGPGATNCVTPVRDCMADSVPMVLICGQVPVAAMGTDAFQEAAISNIMAPCAKHVFLVTDPTKLEDTLRSAFTIARTGRPGPVVIDIPKDVQNFTAEFKGTGSLNIPGYQQRILDLAANQMSAQSCEDFMMMLKRSQRPLIYAGGGVINAEASNELREFAHGLGIPITTTLMGIGAEDTTHANALHMLGMHGTAFANYAVDDCDFLIAVGARFDDRVAAKPDGFAPSAKYIAHFDVDVSEIGKVKSVDWHHIGELKSALNTLIQYSKDHKVAPDYSNWHAHIADLKSTYPMNYDRESDQIQPYLVIEELNRITKGEAIVSTGVGQHQMWAAQYFDFKQPRHWLTSGSMGTMGFGLPAAIGAQFAQPDKVVIDIDGDGSIRMNIGEMETVTNYNLPVKIVLLNNECDGMVRQWQKLFFDGRFSASDKALHKKNFVAAAKADGYQWAKRVTDKAELSAALEDFIAFDGPAFIEVMIDDQAGVYPMVGPGASYAEMITGDWIPSRDPNAPKSAASSTPTDAF